MSKDTIHLFNNLSVKGIVANGSVGAAGEVLHSNGTIAYWAVDDNSGGTVTSVATANGLSGGPITTTGTIGVVSGSTLTVNTTGIHVNTANLSVATSQLTGDVALGANTSGNYVATITAGNGISGSSSSEGGTPTIAVVAGNGVASNSIGVHVVAGNGTVVSNTSGVYVNAAALSIATSQLTGDVALGANTSGNYVATITNANGISGSSASEGGTPTIGVVTGSTLTVNTTGIHVNSALSITDLALTGNLTVSGTRTYVNTTTLEVGDNIVTLNADLGAFPPTENAGIEIMRGTSANVQFIWDESNDRWTTNSQPLAISSLVAAGAASGITTLAAGNTTITGFANVTSTIQGGSSLSIAGALSGVTTAAMGNTTITGFANVTGTIQGGSSLTIAGAASGITTLAAGNTTITGFANVTSTIQVGGSATFANTVIVPLGSAAAPSYTFTGDLNTGMWSPGADTLAFSEGGAEVMRIDSAGNIGIGTTTPGRRLSLRGGGFAFDDANTTPRSLHWGDGTTYPVLIQGDATNNFLAIQTASTERMRIDSSGNIGIGTTAPSYRLQIQSASSPYVAINTTSGTDKRTGIVFLQGGTAQYEIGVDVSVNNNKNFYIYDAVSASSRFNIDASGNVGIGTTAPGAKLDVNGSAHFGGTIVTGTGVSTGDAHLELGGNRTGDGAAYVDLHAVTGTDFEARMVRYGGTNGILEINNSGTGGMLLNSSGAAAMAFQTTATERMRITAGGNVGIGTSAPLSALAVIQSGAGYASQATHKGTIQIAAGPASLQAGGGLEFLTSTFSNGYGWKMSSIDSTGVHLVFGNRSDSATWTERMRIDSDGDVGIGTAAPTTIFHVQQNNTGNIGMRMRQLSTTQFAGAGLLCNGPVSSSTQGGTAFYHYNRNTGGTNGALAMAQFDENGSFQRSLAEYYYQEQAWIFYTNGSERMRINSSGNIGIGTSSPTERLDTGTGNTRTQALVISGDQHLLYSVDASTLGIRIGAAGPYYGIGTTGSDNMRINSASGGDMLFAIGGTERARINNSGNMGIGTNGPGYRLDIASGDTTANIGYAMRLRSNATATAATLQFTNSGVTTQNGVITCRDDGVMVVQADGASSLLAFRTNGNERARINSSGEFLTGTSTGGRAVCMFASDMWLRLSNASRQWLIGPSIGSNFNIYDETGGYTAFSIDTSANINARNSIFLGSGQNLDNKIEIGAGRTGSNYAYIDLIGDTTYTDYGLRLIRGNTGPNTTSQITHRGTGDMYISTEQAATLYFQTNATTRAYFQSDGTMVMNNSLFVGRVSASTDINVANDTGSFSVRGNTSTVAVMSFHRTSAYAINMGLGTDNVLRIGGWSAANNCFQMDGSGNLTMLGNVTAYSDVRMKEDIETIDRALELVSKMRGVRFTRTDNGMKGIGVIAQEMLEVIPEVVQQGVGSDDTLSVAYGNLVGVLIEAVKELTARVAKLEGK